jgi:uncharacterized protein (TIGR02147 family)
MESQIYKFTDIVEYLNFTLEEKRLKNGRFSLRAWSRQLGYTNPSMLSHILKGERKLNLKAARTLSDNLRLIGDGKKYFDLLVLIQNCKTVEEKNIYFELITSLRPQSEESTRSLSVGAFRIISDWYHIAILEMVGLADFKNDLQYIFGRLGGKVSLTNIEKALSRLKKMELLEETAKGKLKRVQDNSFLLENHIPSEAIRHFHKQMIEKAQDSVEGQKVDERYLQGSMLSVRKSELAKAQKIIKKAHAELLRLSCSGDGDELYYLNTQFFKITQ